MPEYLPLRLHIQDVDQSLRRDLGALILNYEPFLPDIHYSFANRDPTGSLETVVPKTGPPIGDLPELIQRMIKSTWKLTEPSDTNVQGSRGITIGTRDGAVPASGANYHAQARPTKTMLPSKLQNEDAIASDWKLFDLIQRTNAVTFRGDSRSPLRVISEAHGFYPPNSRKDDDYLENNIVVAFQDYISRRYQDIPPDPKKILDAIKAVAVSPEAKKLVVDYMMWRKITEGEAIHLGRMVQNECLKGYISTARSIDTALGFATANGARPGWVYLTVVHGGFVVPLGKQDYWGSHEWEIAQWGPIPDTRIVGFVHAVSKDNKLTPEGPIFILRNFRWSEPDAFKRMFKIMSGMTPAQQ